MMTAKEAMKILDAMADGVNPKTGDLLPSDSVVNQRNVIRALQMALEAMKSQHLIVDIPKTTTSKSVRNSRKSTNSILVVKNKSTKPMPVSEPILEDYLYLLEDKKMFGYLDIFRNNKIVPTISRVGKCLVGSRAKSVYALVKNFSCYGILDGITTYSHIKPQVTSFFEKNSNIIENEYSNQDKPWVEIDFFDKQLFDNLTPIIITQLADTVTTIPFKRINSEITPEHILLARKVHFRAYEPWLQKENELLLRSLRYTNDLEKLSVIFKRGESAIRSQGQKLLYHIEAVLKGNRARGGK